jgi:hypothetical protein
MPATWVDRSARWNDAAKYLKISGILFYFACYWKIDDASFNSDTGGADVRCEDCMHHSR